MNYNTILFDLDGTLLNTLDDLCDSTNYALRSHGFSLRTLEEVKAFVGNGAFWPEFGIVIKHRFVFRIKGVACT